MMKPLEVRFAEANDRLVIQWMVSRYWQDLALYSDQPMTRFRLESCQVSHYWDTPHHFAFAFLEQNRYVGYALVDDHVFLMENHWWMSHFFIDRPYRRQGLGTQAAIALFNQLPGRWEIAQSEANLPAQQFWRTVIQEYTAGEFSDLYLEEPDWTGPLQCFDNRDRSIEKMT